MGAIFLLKEMALRYVHVHVAVLYMCSTSMHVFHIVSESDLTIFPCMNLGYSFGSFYVYVRY